jgi:hypothetical protein
MPRPLRIHTLQWENNQMKRSIVAAIFSDVHLWVPVCVLLGGICLLVVLR